MPAGRSARGERSPLREPDGESDHVSAGHRRRHLGRCAAGQLTLFDIALIRPRCGMSSDGGLVITDCMHAHTPGHRNFPVYPSALQRLLYFAKGRYTEVNFQLFDRRSRVADTRQPSATLAAPVPARPRDRQRTRCSSCSLSQQHPNRESPTDGAATGIALGGQARVISPAAFRPTRQRARNARCACRYCLSSPCRTS